MFWLYLALLAYLINAIVFIVDKHLLAAPIPKYHAYAFGVSVLSLFSLLLIPLGVSWRGLEYLGISISSGAVFFVGLMFLYKAVKESDISVAATQTGTFGAVFTYVFSIFILKDTLPLFGSFAILFLVLGIFLLGKTERRIFLPAILSGLCFGLYFVLLKLVFNLSNFVDGLFWTRMGFVGSAFLSLFSGHVRREVKFSYNNASNSSKLLFVFNKFLAGVGFVMLYLSIQLGNVSIVNALLGFQFAFTFLLVLILRNRLKGIQEKMDRKTFMNKVFGIASIMAGILMLFYK